MSVITGACHGTEALDIPVRMSGIGHDLLRPDALLDHTSILATVRTFIASTSPSTRIYWVSIRYIQVEA
jgi:hypothetical protein